MRSISFARKCVVAIGLSALGAGRVTAGEYSEYKPTQMDPACQAGGPKGEYETKDLPARFIPFVPFIQSDERLLMVACVTIPDRPDLRFLMATKAPNRVGAVSILVRERSSLRLEAVNSTAVELDGVEGSGASGGFGWVASTRPGSFTINNSFGDSQQLTVYEFNFLYSAAASAWLLDSVVTKVATREGQPGKRQRYETVTRKQTTKDFGRVLFTGFDAKQYGVGD